MKRKHTDSQILEILQERDRYEGTVENYCREKGISSQTYYAWKRKFHGMDEKKIKENRELEKENALLKKLLVEKDIALKVTQEFIEKKGFQFPSV